MLDSSSVAPKYKEQVIKAGDYLAEWLVTVAILVDKRMPEVVALYDAILYGKVGGLGLGRHFCLMLPMGLPAESYSPS